MKKFVYYPNRDKGEIFLRTLEESGLYEQAHRVSGSDFLLTDYEGRCPTDITNMLKHGKCVFVYPHAALTFISYDGMYPSNLNITANFVPSFGQRQVMWRYGYRCKVLPIGWPYSPVLPFKPSINKTIRVLFAPNHSILSSRKRFASHYWDRRWWQNSETFNKLIKIPDIELTIYHHGDIYKDNNIPNIKHGGIHYIESDLSVKNSVGIIGSGNYDMVVGFDTFSWISVAMGIPTLMFGQDLQWEGVLGKARHWDDYKDYIRYPYDILDPNFNYEMLRELLGPNNSSHGWKLKFIGESFNKNAFLNNIRMELEAAEQARIQL